MRGPLPVCAAGVAPIVASAQRLENLHLNCERLPELLEVLLLGSDLSESHPTATDHSVGDDDIDGNQPIETDTRDRVGPGSN